MPRNAVGSTPTADVGRPDDLDSPSGIVRRTRRTALALLVAVVSALGLALVSPQPAMALNGGDFQAGLIISDAVFYNSAALDAGGVQSFLDGQYQGCNSGYVCLRDYTLDTPNQAAETNLCAGYAGAAGERASTVIAKIAISCRVNPQALLVLLQKESSLITSKSPSYRTATGFGCPDTAACDTRYFGFFNQVYLAARQFQLYRLNPNNYGYVAGRNNNILFNPNTGCGSSSVYIQNQATAGLYNYTPYQPNAAALANLTGTGDSCSSYGNRNFWVFFNTWFGSPAYTPAVGSPVSCLGTSTGSDTPSTLLTGALPAGVPTPGRTADLVAVDGAGQSWLYPNVGGASPFTVRVPTGASNLAYFKAVTLGDVSGDGRADLIASAPDGALWYFIGNGTSTPFAAGGVRVGANWGSFDRLLLVDANGDGRADLLATTADGRMFYYVNNGTSSPFGATLALGPGWQNFLTLSTGDVDGDGRGDIVATSTDGRLWLYKASTAANPYSDFAIIAPRNWQAFNRVYVADMDGDGRGDLVATSPDGRLWQFTNNTTATPFVDGVVIGGGGWQNYSTMLLANTHGRGNADLVGRRPDGSLWLYQNNGTTTPYTGLANVGSTGWQNFDKIAIGDLNGDFGQDLVATSTDGRLFFYPNQSACAPFTGYYVIGATGWQNFNRFMLADVNGDGLGDIVSTSADGRLWYYQNNRTGSPYTTPAVIGLSGWQNFTTLLLGDVNGDRKADLVAVSTDGRLWYYQNNGTATPYTDPVIIGASGWQNFTRFTLRDVNADGRADVLATSGDGRLWYSQNNGTAAPFNAPTVIGAAGWNAYNLLL